LRQVKGNVDPVDEHWPELPPVQVALRPGQSLSVMHPVQEPDTQRAPSHCESIVHDLPHVPGDPPLHTSDEPQSLSLVHVEEVHPELPQLLLPQCESRVQTQTLFVQVPRLQGLLPEHGAGTHVPVVPALQVAPDIEQSRSLVQVCVVQVPFLGGVQVAPNPQSASVLHAPLRPLTSASADTWKSL
jgi:hypothetical protein